MRRLQEQATRHSFNLDDEPGLTFSGNGRDSKSCIVIGDPTNLFNSPSNTVLLPSLQFNRFE
jgi:hypothetical protein